LECAPPSSRGRSNSAPGVKPDVSPEDWFDLYADSFTALADMLGAAALGN
jgi:hypothetical protein